MANQYRLQDRANQGVEIDNPLARRTVFDIESDVRAFHTRLDELHGIVDVDMLIKGAQIAKDTNAIYTLNLTETEIAALQKEKESTLRGLADLFHQMEGLNVTIMATACAAVALGWLQSAINTSAQTWPAKFCISNDPWKVGIINAVPALSGSIIGTWVSDPLQGFRLKGFRNFANFYLGRRFAMMLSGLVSVICCIWSARCKSWEELLACRVILGVGVGTKASVAPIFAAEAAMEKSRGRILMLWQLFDALGILLGFATALIAPKSWEVQLGAALIPSAALMLLVALCPESPRLLIRKKRYREAYECLRRLRTHEIQAARDFYFIHVQLQREVNVWREEPVEAVEITDFSYQNWVEKQNTFQRMKYLFTLPRNRRACLVAFLVMASQQLCGINVLAFYSSTIFSSMNPQKSTSGSTQVDLCTSNSAQGDFSQVNLLNFGFGLANFLFTLPAFFLIDYKGRRFILLSSFLGMTFSLLGASFCFEIRSEGGLIAAVVVTVILFFTCFYSIGAGPVPYTLSAEIFPLAFREVGMSFSVMVNFLGLGLLVLFIPKATAAWGGGSEGVISRRGQQNILLLFTGLNALMFILLFLIVPSTERLTLEDMNYLFSQTTMQHIGRHAGSARSFFLRKEIETRDSDRDSVEQGQELRQQQQTRS